MSYPFGSREVHTKQASRSIMTGFAAIALGCWLGMAPPAHAFDDNSVTPPPTPAPIAVPPGNTAFLVGHATGTQGYTCLPSGSTFSWTVTGARPEANLLDDQTSLLITHFLSPNPGETPPNPFENGNPRPTWQNSQDMSAVWGNKIASINAGSDPSSCPTVGAIPCLLLQVVGSRVDPNGDDTGLSTSTYVQRLNTTGGSAPATPQAGCAQCCAASTDIGHQVLIPYTADYYFFQAQGSGDQGVKHQHSATGGKH